MSGEDQVGEPIKRALDGRAIVHADQDCAADRERSRSRPHLEREVARQSRKRVVQAELSTDALSSHREKPQLRDPFQAGFQALLRRHCERIPRDEREHRVLVGRLLQLPAGGRIELRRIEAHSEVERKTIGMGGQRCADPLDRPQRVQTGDTPGGHTEAARREGLVHHLGGVHIRESEPSLRQRRGRCHELRIVGDCRRRAHRHVDHPSEADRVVAQHDDVLDDRVGRQRGAGAEDVHAHASVLTHPLGPERSAKGALEGGFGRGVVLAGDEDGRRGDVVVRSEVHDHRDLRAKPRQHVLVREARASKSLVERVSDLPSKPLVVPQCGEPTRQRHQVDLLARRRIEVGGDDDLARGRDELEELLARPSHEDESGCGGASHHHEEGRDHQRQQSARAAHWAGGRWRKVDAVPAARSRILLHVRNGIGPLGSGIQRVPSFLLTFSGQAAFTSSHAA